MNGLSQKEWRELLKALSQPFPASSLQFRAGATTKDKKKAQALVYVDPREYEKRLDELCSGSWHCSFKPWGENRIICSLTIHGISRSSTGEENEGFAPGTAAEAQAFKRSCSKFGLGRYLYELKVPWVNYDPIKKKLLETPILNSQFLNSKPSQAGLSHLPPNSSTNKSDNTLSRPRAETMHRELAKLGFKRDSHYSLASIVARRPIKSLTTLTDDQASRVWGLALREANKGISQNSFVSDEEAATVLN